MKYVVPLGVGALVLLAYAALMAWVVWWRRARRRRIEERLQSLGFTRSQAEIFGADHHWIGSPRGRPALVGFYPGSPRSYGYAGLLLMLHVGALPGETWGADLLSTPPKLNGRGEGGDRLRAALTDEVVAAAAGLPEPQLMPSEGLLEGTILHGVVAGGWPGGWSGMHLRTVLPTKADLSLVRATFEQMHRVAEAVERAAP